MPDFGMKSSEVLNTLHPVLQILCNRVVEHYDITLLTGHRNKEDQNKAFHNGVSSKMWPESRHNTLPSMAVDPSPWPIPEGWGDLDSKTPFARDLDWKERVKFYEMVAVFRFAWSQLCAERPEIADNYTLRFGADWDGDGDYRDQKFDDLVHIEIWEK